MISTNRLRASLALGAQGDPLLLAELVARARAFVEQQTHRYFGEPVTRIDVLTGPGTRHLRLPEQVFDDDTPLTVTEQAYPGAATTALTLPTDFVLRHDGTTSYLVRVGGAVWTADFEYLVSFKRGYPINGLPGDVEALILALVGTRLNMMGDEGKASETIGGYSYSRAAIHAFEDGDLRAIPGAVRTIAAWRPVVFA